MIPLKINMSNFFSHRNSEVDFTLFDSALLIGNVDGNYKISNGSGKSAVFEAILWCLFNKSRVAAMDDIILWGENECKVELVFSHEGIEYRILRTRSRVTSTSEVSFECKNEGGNWVDLSGSTARLTNQAIIEKICFDYKTFVNSTYFRQSDISEFTEADPSKKKGILKSIIDISKWDDYEKKAKEIAKKTTGECEVLSTLCEGYDALCKNLTDYEKELEQLCKDAESKSSKKKATEESLSKLKQEYDKIKKNLDTDQWDRVSQEISDLEKEIKIERSLEEKLSLEKNKYQDKIVSIEKNIEDCKENANKLTIVDDDEDKLNDLQRGLIDFGSKASAAAMVLKKLEKRNIVHGECYACGQDINEESYEELMNEYRQELEENQKNKVYSENKVKELTSKVSGLENSIRNRRKRDALLASVRNMGSEVEIAKTHLDKILSELTLKKDLVHSMDNKISLNKEIIDSLRNENFQDIRSKIEDLKLAKQSLDLEVGRLNREIGIYTERVANSKEKISDMSNAKKKLIEKTNYASKMSKLAKMFGKNGIQTILLNAVIEDLEKTSNKILTTICNEPFSILLETQRVGSDGVSIVDTLDLIVNKDGIKQNFKSLSGGEKFRVSLALRIALSEISSRHGGSSLEFLLLDEINSPLDRQGTEMLFTNIIPSLEEKYKILVITHDEFVKDQFDNVVDISKTNGESMVTFVSR